MYVILIILSTFLGWLLLLMGPLYGGLLAFGIIAGTLFRGLYLLNDINKRLLKITPTSENVPEDLSKDKIDEE